jgi:hypothetical protein
MWLSLIFSGKNYWFALGFFFVVLTGILYLRFTIIDEAIQELTLPKQEILKNIDFFLSKIKYSETNDSEKECIICLEDFKKSETIFKINCNCSSNYYHKSCLKKWFQKNCSCPVCRKNLREPNIEL